MNQLELAIRTERRLMYVFNGIMILLAWALFFWAVQCEEPAKAEQNQNAYRETVYRLTQCVIGECDYCVTNPKERDAIGWCLKKQAWMLKRTLLKQTISYCAFYKQKTERSVFIFNSYFDYPIHGKKKLWNETRAWARAFLNSPPSDPTPEADQWGGSMDVPRAKRLGLRRIAGPPEYANTFFQSLAFARVIDKFNINIKGEK